MWTVVFILVAAIGGYMVAMYFQKKDGETADEIAAANAWQPLIFEQGFDTIPCRLRTIEMAEQAVEMLKKHGNKFLKAGIYPHGDVHLWVHGFDAENTTSDFAEWAFKNTIRRTRLLESFRQLKSKAAALDDDKAEAARMFAGDYEEYQNS